MSDDAGLTVRTCARALLFDGAGHLLLFHYVDDWPLDPARPDMTAYWATPGGAVEEGENHEEALRRELREETGFAVPRVGGPVARRRVRLELPIGPTLSDEWYFDVRIDGENPPPDLSGQAAYELSTLKAWRWWRPADLASAAGIVVPRGLAPLAAGLAGQRMRAAPVWL